MSGPDPLHDYLSILQGKARPRFQELKGGPTSELSLKVAQAERLEAGCALCEHRCGANRREGRPGRCGVLRTKVASHFIHYGEERPLVPSYTVFLAGCNLRCVFCQNWDISTDAEAGEVIEPGVLARMIEARGIAPIGAPACRGIRNVNWVGGDPIPHLPYVLRVLQELELDVPQVWNSNMYMTREALEVLAGTMDVYLTDLKFGNDRCARELCGAPRYWEVVTRNHLQAARQGEVVVRHLMLPGHLECCTLPVLEWLGEHLPQAAVNVMDQYRPEHRARQMPAMARGVSPTEHRVALERAGELGLLLI